MTSLLAAAVAAAVASAPAAPAADTSSPLDSLAAAPVFSENQRSCHFFSIRLKS